MCTKKLVVLALSAFVAGLLVGPAAQAGDPTLMAWWKLDDGAGTVALDSSDYGNHGTVMNPNAGLGTGGSVWVDDPDRGMVISFNGADGSGAYVTTDVTIPALTMDNGFTWTFWAKQPAAQATNNDVILGNRYGGTSSPLQFCKFTPTRFENYNDDGAYANGINYMSIPSDVWIHHALVKDGAEMTYYRDGVVMMTNTMIKTNDPNPFYMGADGFSGAQENWQGYLSDVRLYTRALTEKEVQDVMAGKGPTSEFATDPMPEQEAVDVPRDTVLSWTPGQYAVTHDVYFGMEFEDVEAATRTDPMGVLLSQGQTAATFDPPGILELGQTYYWRVDEVNAAPDHTIYKGEVWSFTVEPVAYPIANVVATSNGISDDISTAQTTVDGSGLNAADQHSVENADMWLARAPEDEPLWIQFQFDRIYKLHEMLVWNHNSQFELLLGFGIRDVTVEFSEDGMDWTTLGDVELAQATARATYTANTTVDFDGVAARYVRLVVNRAWGTRDQFGLSEVRFLFIPVQAREPQPADGAMGITPETSLRWRAGREAVSHEVYIGADPEAMTLAGTTDAAIFAPGDLELGATYYWQIVEVNEVEEIAAWASDIWSFSTQEYILIDGFESYTDDIDAGEAIFDTWLDGWVNDTGSTVGYLQAPYAERTIVRSGRQSMPLFYDNTTSPNSEAERQFATPQDWTRYGVQALTLYFSGDPDNSAQQMYVKVRGSKVLYDGDPDDLRQTAWRPWTIDLADFGVNLRSVTELTIGIERIGATGGTGVVYFDDIKLDPMIPAAGRFSIRPWTGDDDSGISGDKVYTHAGKFAGEGAAGEPFFAGNGVYFERDADGAGTDWALTGPATNVFDTSNPVNVTGDGAELVRGFVYGDQDTNHPVLTLTGLVPGTTYVATFYAVGYGEAGGRFVDITPADNLRNPTRIDQNAAGSGNGQLIKYTYVAAGTEMSFVFDALVTGDSWHHYAFSNEVASSN